MNACSCLSVSRHHHVAPLEMIQPLRPAEKRVLMYMLVRKEKEEGEGEGGSQRTCMYDVIRSPYVFPGGACLALEGL